MIDMHPSGVAKLGYEEGPEMLYHIHMVDCPIWA